jgi:mannose/fructose/N-acetylgalactosamine-specific phosphotransferase system component IID
MDVITEFINNAFFGCSAFIIIVLGVLILGLLVSMFIHFYDKINEYLYNSSASELWLKMKKTISLIINGILSILFIISLFMLITNNFKSCSKIFEQSKYEEPFYRR